MCPISREEQRSCTLLLLKEGCYLVGEVVLLLAVLSIWGPGAETMVRTPGDLDSGSPFSKMGTRCWIMCNNAAEQRQVGGKSCKTLGYLSSSGEKKPYPKQTKYMPRHRLSPGTYLHFRCRLPRSLPAAPLPSTLALRAQRCPGKCPERLLPALPAPLCPAPLSGPSMP